MHLSPTALEVVGLLSPIGMDRGEGISASSEGRGLEGSAEAVVRSQEDSGVDGAGQAESHQHWCYQCNKEVIVESGGDEQGMVCVECRSGFVEIMSTAVAVPDVRRAQRHRRHQGGAGNIHLHGRRGGSLVEALDHLYPQQLMQVLQLLGQASHTSSQPPSPLAPSDAPTARDVPIHGREMAFQRLTEVALQGTDYAPEVLVEDEGVSASGRDVGGEAGGNGGREQGREQARVGRMGLANPFRLLVREQAQEEGGEGDGSESEGDADTEAMPLELDGWDSLEEDEWEEVEENEENEAGGEPISSGGQAAEPLEQPRLGRRRRARELHNLQMRTRTIENTLHHYLQDLLQNLVGQNIEVRVELPQGGNHLYVGNPGDYVDARGFEQLLQQMAETDNSRRGAPPASKSAIESLPTVMIERVHLDEGTALCAVCKDVVALGEPAKQLPCLHLYHHDCILPWLSSRNSCPICRYELPTDDPDYEQQRQGSRAIVASQDGGLAARQPAGDSGSDGDQQQAEQGSGQGSVGAVDGAEEVMGSSDSGSGNSDGGGTSSGGSGGPRGWFLLGAAPVLSMMGVVLMLCLRNHVMGRSLEVNGGPRIQRQQSGLGLQQEPRPLEQVLVGGSSMIHSSRLRWWMPFQRSRGP